MHLYCYCLIRTQKSCIHVHNTALHQRLFWSVHGCNDIHSNLPIDIYHHALQLKNINKFMCMWVWSGLPHNVLLHSFSILCKNFCINRLGCVWALGHHGDVIHTVRVHQYHTFADTTDTSTLTSKYWPVPVPIPITTDVITEALNWLQKVYYNQH